MVSVHDRAVSSVFPQAKHCLLLRPRKDNDNDDEEEDGVTSSSSSAVVTDNGRTQKQKQQRRRRRRRNNHRHHRHEWTNVHTVFDATMPPALIVNVDEMVHVQTVDCFSNLVKPPMDDDDNNNNHTVDSVEEWQLNPVTGPIYVNGTDVGDILAVTIHNIIPMGVGVASCSTTLGQLCHTVGKEKIVQQQPNTKTTTKTKNNDNGRNGFSMMRAGKKKHIPGESAEGPAVSSSSSLTRFFDLSPDGSTVTMREAATVMRKGNDGGNIDEGCNGCSCQKHQMDKRQRRQQRRQQRIGPISFPTTPMLGVIGVAPTKEDGPISTMPAGRHGGNLDNKYNGIGSTIYLKVNVKGALLSIGDMHASQGDGEICGTGIEIGGHVLLSCRVLKHDQVYGTDNHHHPLVCNFPITETPQYWMTYGVVVENIPKATIVACEEASKLLTGQWGFSPEEAFIFLSVRGDLGLCQSCHPDTGTQIARMRIPKLLDGGGPCPRPFRCLLDDDDVDSGHGN